MLKDERQMESAIEKKHPEERGSKPVKKKETLKHPELKNVDSKEHMLPLQEELEIMIRLCGSKKELIDVLNHINRMVLETSKKVNSEIKIRKMK